MDDPNALYQLDRALTREQLINALDGIPGRLHALLDSRDAGTLLRRGSAEDWTPMECLRHIRDAVQVYGMRFKWMILDNDPFLPNYDENRWASESPDGPADVPGMLAEISSWWRNCPPSSGAKAGELGAPGPARGQRARGTGGICAARARSRGAASGATRSGSKEQVACVSPSASSLWTSGGPCRPR